MARTKIQDPADDGKVSRELQKRIAGGGGATRGYGVVLGVQQFPRIPYARNAQDVKGRGIHPDDIESSGYTTTVKWPGDDK